jgi:imidazolonepropionase-like amidohydrolase
VSPTTLEKLNALVAPGLKAVELAKRKNIPMAYGTDLVGLELHEFQLNEFSIRREVVSAQELLRSATVIGAELIRMEKLVGRVEEGYLADLIAIKGNPLDDITVLERPEDSLVLGMKEGQIFKNVLS